MSHLNKLVLVILSFASTSFATQESPKKVANVYERAQTFTCQMPENSKYGEYLGTLNQMAEDLVNEIAKSDSKNLMAIQSLVRVVNCAFDIQGEDYGIFDVLVPVLNSPRKKAWILREIRALPPQRQSDINDNIRAILREQKKGNG